MLDYIFQPRHNTHQVLREHALHTQHTLSSLFLIFNAYNAALKEAHWEFDYLVGPLDDDFIFDFDIFWYFFQGSLSYSLIIGWLYHLISIIFHLVHIITAKMQLASSPLPDEFGYIRFTATY